MDPEACHYAAVFTNTVIPGFFFLSQFDAIRGYLNTMNKSSVIMYASLSAAFLHLFWAYLFIHVLDMEVRGASIATTITYFSQFMFVSVYCNFNKELQSSYFFPGPETFEDLGEYFK